MIFFIKLLLPKINLTQESISGREKLELGDVVIRVVLEADGTQVEDPEYFSTLPENTVFLLLRQGEHWYPAGVEVLRQGKNYHGLNAIVKTPTISLPPQKITQTFGFSIFNSFI